MRCRVCGGADLGPVIDLGPMPLVNNLLRDPDEACPRWPLEVVRCRHCTLGQLTSTPPPDLMFREYAYFSSQTPTMVAHARGLVERHVAPDDRVLEIASNDGYLLAPALERGATVLGVEPAANVAAAAEARGVPTHVAYFDRATAEGLRGSFGPADVIFANNVLAHVPDPHEIAAGIAVLLADGGTAHVEVPSFARLVRDGAFDTVYHEHHGYFTLTALRALFAAHELAITGVRDVPVHGESLHVEITREGDTAEADERVRAEHAGGLRRDAFYADFADRVRALCDELVEVVDDFPAVAAYGAAAKGIVLLNACGLGPDRVPWVADVSPHKQGRFVPGTRQPIVAPARLRAEMPPACLILPWNLEAEIRRQEEAYAERGGRFIVPLPRPRVVGSEVPAGV